MANSSLGGSIDTYRVAPYPQVAPYPPTLTMEPFDGNDDATLLAGARRGDRRCTEQLVNKYKDLAYTLAFRILDSREDAEEVVQDSFMRALRSLGTFNQSAKFSTWFYRIVYNTAVSRLRGAKMQSVVLDENDEIRETACLTTEQLNQVNKGETKNYLSVGLGRLPEEDRIILTLHYLGEKSVSEIATILSLGNSAIKMRLLRARKQLKRELDRLLNKEAKDLL